MTNEQLASSPEDETLARHRALAEVIDGKRPMEWSDWAIPIYDSRCLTSQGQRIALEAVEILRHALGGKFLQRAAAAPALNNIFSMALWPGVNDVPWVYANLFQLSAQFALLGKCLRPVQRAMRDNLHPINWIHALLQLELAGLGLRAGWQIEFEQVLINGKQADVQLTSGSTRLLVEMVSMQISDAERSALAFFRRLSGQVQNLTWLNPVRITGSLGSPLPPQDETEWLKQIEAAVYATVKDGATQLISSPAAGRLEISREATVPGTISLEGVPVTEDVWSRVEARLNDKNKQYAGAGPAWVRLEEYAGLWQFTPLQGMKLSERLNSLVPALQETLAFYPNLAGVIMSPAVWWAGSASPEELRERIERNGGIALRCPLPGHRFRESIIVARAPLQDTGAKMFAGWYAQEESWLEWALEQLGYPSFDALVWDFPGEGDH